MIEEIIVSVIIPVYNEEKYIECCLNSIIHQSYPSLNMEIIIADGMSNDRTREIVDRFSDKLNIRVLDNKKRFVTYALNLAIENSIGKYIIRLDAHAEFAPDYIEKCVYYLENTDADNVGGVAETVGIGHKGKMNAEILSSKFGVGNSAFRTEDESKYVDTVPFGAFRRTVFERVGLFNPDLPRSEDNDMNSRIRSSGGKIFMSSDIKFKYYCRDTVKGLLSQGLKNGNALFLTLRRNPKAMSLRHFVPFFFVMSLLLMPILATITKIFVYIFMIELSLYMVLNVYFSLFCGTKNYFAYKLFMYPIFHIVYGFGSIIGMLNIKLY